MTVGRLIMILFGAGAITNQAIFHITMGDTNPFQCEEGWCVITGVIYLVVGLGSIISIIAICAKYWNTTIKL